MSLKRITVEPKPLEYIELEGRKYLADNDALGPIILSAPDYTPVPSDDTNYALMKCGCIFTFPADDFSFYWQQCENHQDSNNSETY